MRREKRLAENEERYRAEQDRRRAKRKMNSLPMARQPDGGDGSAAGDRRAIEGMRRQAAGFYSASER
jgi:hypothetical protein